MKKNFLTLIFVIRCLFTLATDYYVSPSGSGSNNGLSIQTPWSMAKACTTAIAGDRVWCVAGSYTGAITFTQSGTCEHHIIFQGYTDYPGDQPTILTDRANPYADMPSSSTMPLFTGTNRNTGTCFNLTAVSNVELNNFMGTAYSIGVSSGSTDTITSSSNKFFNVCFQTLGNTVAAYDGKGFLIGNRGTTWSDRNTLKSCLVIDCCAEAFDIAGDDNIIDNCIAHDKETVSGNSFMDYYFVTPGKRNLFINCKAYRLSTLSGTAHGFTNKGNSEATIDAGSPEPQMDAKYNRWISCIARNMDDAFTVRHRNSSYNIIYKCEAYGTHTGANGSPGGLGNLLTIRDGASFNYYYACKGDSLANGIYITDTSEDGGVVGHTSDSNFVYSCTIANTYIPIRGVLNSALSTDAGKNVIENCTIVLGRYMLDFAIPCTSIVFRGNIFYGTSGIADQQFDGGANHPVAAQYTDNDIYLSTTGTTPILAAVGTMTVNPTFTNIATRDLTLQASSTLRDKCTHLTVTTNPVVMFATRNNKLWQFNVGQYNFYDADGKPRKTYGTYPDMGSHEYQP